MKTKINPESGDSGRPYAHLLPIVQFIVGHGNEAYKSEFFYNTQDGWRCDLKQLIDLDEVENNFDLPDTVIINRIIGVRVEWHLNKGITLKKTTS